MKRIRRTMIAATAGLLAMGGMIVIGEPASAAHVSCGAVITQDTTLDSDLLNCPSDGLLVQGSNITIDLAGHTLSGRSSTNTTPMEQAGIRLMNVTGVVVKNGTITNFDAGVVIGRGSGNSIQNLVLRRNINHSTLTGTINPCNLGDGIVAFDSDNNRIRNNRAVHNGPFSGISLVGDSDGNVVLDNTTRLQDIENAHPNFVTEARPFGNGPCGPFVPGVGNVGAVRQGVGVRVEGPGANNNRVESNQVNNNDAFGILIHGYVCNPLPGTPQQAGENNGNNVVIRNNVVANGFSAQLGGGPTIGDGIGIPAQGPDAVVCTSHTNSVLLNTVTANARHGIHLAHRGTHDNNISRNIVRDNGVDGIRVEGPRPDSSCGNPLTTPCPGAINNRLVDNVGSGNGEHDAHDGNEACDNNRWRNNAFETVFQGCERNS